MKYPFEASFDEVQSNLDTFVSVVFSSLESEFLILPKGSGFVDYCEFERAYESLKKATKSFQNLSAAVVLKTVKETPLSLVILRTMLGFTPPEWAYLATQRTGVEIPPGYARMLDRKVRTLSFSPLALSPLTTKRLEALVETACQLLNSPVPRGDGEIHRLDKADTQEGAEGIKRLATLGVPYPMLLYERFLGRPFAGHRDSVSELVGDSLESAIENVLMGAGISYRKTKRAEKLPGFDQAPDFVIPDEFTPQVIIEAKITEDDGTARDKVTRIQHLASLSVTGQPGDVPRFEVLACIAGRGFGVRREDMRKLLLATRGKVFTLRTIDKLVECSRLRDFRTK